MRTQPCRSRRSQFTASKSSREEPLEFWCACVGSFTRRASQSAPPGSREAEQIEVDAGRVSALVFVERVEEVGDRAFLRFHRCEVLERTLVRTAFD